jgi:hypothetical protein
MILPLITGLLVLQTPDIRAIADSALAAPPELAADILLRLVSSGKIADKDRRTGMVETAYRLAPGAKYPLRLVPAKSITTDSMAGVVSNALQEGLDSLSLQTRAISAMLDLNPPRALEMFNETRLGIPRAGCRDMLVANVDSYYLLLPSFARRAFTSKQIEDGKDMEFLRSNFVRLQSPVEVRIAEITIHGFPEQIQESLWAAHITALQQLSGDDRSFDYASGGRRISVPSAAPKQTFQSAAHAVAQRRYLVKHLNGTRCLDNINLTAALVESFNKNIPEGSQINPIKPEETKPAKIEGAAENYQFWLKPKTKGMLTMLKMLRFGGPEKDREFAERPPRADKLATFLTGEERSTPEWEALARDFLKDLERWKNDHDETEASYFHQVCLIYQPLIELTPAGALRNSMVRSYLTYLVQSSMRQASPPEWLMHVQRLFRLTDSTPAEHAWMRAEIRATGDLVMSLYADLSEIAPSRR